jgi:hypothetical protein
MKILSNLVTSKAAVVAFIGAALVAARRFGVVLPAGSDDAISKLVDTGISLVGFLFVGSQLHLSDAPEVKS